MSIYNLMTTFPDYAPYDVGPREYLNLIRHAEYVCADSFHGTVFAILHKKPFFTFSRYKVNSTVSTNTRLNSILSLSELRRSFHFRRRKNRGMY